MQKQDAIKIDLNEYVHSGEGANGESFFHLTDPSVMLKLYNSNAPFEIISNELTLARKVFDAGIPTPEPGDLVTDGTRYGIRFRRIQGKISFSRAAGENPDLISSYAERFAALCLKLHGTRIDKNEFPDVKDSYRKMLDENPFFTQEEKVRIREFIASAPDSDTALHGDLQYSNAIMDGKNDYFIDLGDFAHGAPAFDIGMVYLCCCVSDDEFIRDTFHMSPENARKFWEAFVGAYYGKDADIRGIEKAIKPYAGLKTLIIERNTGICFPRYHALLEDVLK